VARFNGQRGGGGREGGEGERREGRIVQWNRKIFSSAWSGDYFEREGGKGKFGPDSLVWGRGERMEPGPVTNVFFLL